MKGQLARFARWVLSHLARVFHALPAPAVPIPPETLSVLPFDPGQMVMRACLNGPCQGAQVHAPWDATPGTACALPWQTVKGVPRYAVYVLVDFNQTQGLMYLKSFSHPEHAQRKVHKITAVCAAGVA